jgi:anti-sigma factor RsiW
MTCEHYHAMLSEFIDNELPSDSMTPLFTHLAACDSCRQMLQEFIGLRAALKSVGDEQMFRKQTQAVRYNDAPARHVTFLRRRIGVPVPALVLVCTALLASLAFVMGSLFVGEERLPQKNVYVITEPVEVLGYYSSQTHIRQ